MVSGINILKEICYLTTSIAAIHFCYGNFWSDPCVNDAVFNSQHLQQPWDSGYHYCTASFNKAWTHALHSSNPARGVMEICDGENHWQWSQLKIKLNTFRRSTIPQKQFITIITILIIINHPSSLWLIQQDFNGMFIHGGMIKKEIQIFFLSEISIYLS